MGQKVHPLGFRLNTTQKHKSTWFSQINQYSSLLEQDAKIRDYITKNYDSAGISDIEESIKKPIDTVKINILGTINTLEASLKSKIKKYLFASSVYVSSNQGGFYRTSKKACELYIEEYNKRHKQKFTII